MEPITAISSQYKPTRGGFTIACCWGVNHIYQLNCKNPTEECPGEISK